MISFSELPLELKLQIVECAPESLKSLIIVDRAIYNYFNTIDGKMWFRRIASVNIDVDSEKGKLLLCNIKDGQWDYYSIFGNDKFLSTSKKYNFGELYEIITYNSSNSKFLKEITPIKNGLKHGKVILYYTFDNIIYSTTTFVNGKKIGEYKQYDLELPQKITYLGAEGNYTDDNIYTKIEYDKWGSKKYKYISSETTLEKFTYSPKGFIEKLEICKHGSGYGNIIKKEFYESGNVKNEKTFENYRVIDEKYYRDVKGSKNYIW